MRLGLDLALASPRRPGPGRPALIRIVPHGATGAYVIAPHAELGAIAYELTFRNGDDASTPPSSIGAPFGGWRWTGTHHLAGVTDDPTSPIATLHQDIGSTDSALQANFGAGLFGGHYHGGIALTSEPLHLPHERYVSGFAFDYAATITWPTGETATVDYRLSIQPDGNLAGGIEYASSHAFTRVFLSMAIANGFTHYGTEGESFVDAGATGTYPLGSANGVILRHGSTGYEIQITTSGQDAVPGLTHEIVSNGSRLKHYVRMTSAGLPLGTVSLGRTIGFRLTEPDPAPGFIPVIATFDGSGDPPAGFTRTHGPNGGTTTSAQVGGEWQVRAGPAAVAPNRWVVPLTGMIQDGATAYQVEIDYASIQANTGMVVYLTRDGSGSTSSGNQLPFNGGQNSLNLNNQTAMTATMSFTLPADAPAPHLTFDASNIPGRGVDIREMRVSGP